MSNNPKKTSSFQAQVIDLDYAESCSKVRSIDPHTAVGDLHSKLTVLRQQLRNTIAPAVKRATDTLGNTYTVEVGDVIMPGGTLYIIAIITRKD